MTGQFYDCTDVQESLFQVDWIQDYVITDYLVGMSGASGVYRLTVVRLDANDIFESYAALMNVNFNWDFLTPKTGGSTFCAAVHIVWFRNTTSVLQFQR